MKVTKILHKVCSSCGMVTLGIIGGKEICLNSDKINRCPSQTVKTEPKKLFHFRRGFCLPGITVEIDEPKND